MLLLDAEDLVEFKDAEGQPRSLRGRIILETQEIVRLQRRDGIWDIFRHSIVKIRRRC